MSAPGIDLQALLRAELASRADPAKAAPMQAYMKSAMPYYGVSAAPLRALCQRIFDAHPISGAEAWQAQCLTLFQEARFREEWYAAIGLSGHRYYRSFQTLKTLPLYEEMIVTGAWWDVVDTIASHRLGPLLEAYPRAMRRKMLHWAHGKNLWKRRSAILCQLSFKTETDLDLLYACIEPSLDSPEFFLRKAIGWALRQYAWTDPREVLRYVRTQGEDLSPLTRREALKNIHT